MKKILPLLFIIASVMTVSCDNRLYDAAEEISNNRYHGIKHLIAGDDAANDPFGNSVAASADGNTVVAGASYGDVSGNTNQGSAWIFAD